MVLDLCHIPLPTPSTPPLFVHLLPHYLTRRPSNYPLTHCTTLRPKIYSHTNILPLSHFTLVLFLSLFCPTPPLSNLDLPPHTLPFQFPHHIYSPPPNYYLPLSIHLILDLPLSTLFTHTPVPHPVTPSLYIPVYLIYTVPSPLLIFSLLLQHNIGLSKSHR